MAALAPPDTRLAPLGGEARPLEEWVTNFHLALVVLDPYTNESAWILETAGRVLETFAGADCRVAFVVVGTEDEARRFLGPWTDRFLTFADPDRETVGAFDLDRLPAFVHVRTDLTVEGAAQGWEPDEWRAVAENLADQMSWNRPEIPTRGDPASYEGSAA